MKSLDVAVSHRQFFLHPSPRRLELRLGGEIQNQLLQHQPLPRRI
jgi:hypothetical protein